MSEKTDNATAKQPRGVQTGGKTPSPKQNPEENRWAFLENCVFCLNTGCYTQWILVKVKKQLPFI